MHEIVKYDSNRRLYSTTEKRYFTLQDISNVALYGLPFMIKESPSGKIIKNKVLASVIGDRVKKRCEDLGPETLIQILKVIESGDYP